MLNRISQLLKWGVVRFADAVGARLMRPDGAVLSIPYVLSFPDFYPSILASFVAGTTASQSGNTVTVTAAGHGIVGSNLRNGYRIYYPGSPSIPAGWYGGFVWVDANKISFTNPASQTVASESVNGGAAYLAQTTVCSLTLPGGSLGPNGRMVLAAQKSGDSTAGVKTIRFMLAGNSISAAFHGALPSVLALLTIANVNSESSQLGQSSMDSMGAVQSNVGAINTALPQTVSVALSLPAAAMWQCVSNCDVTVVRRS